jgi:hypothetical protein
MGALNGNDHQQQEFGEAIVEARMIKSNGKFFLTQGQQQQKIERPNVFLTYSDQRLLEDGKNYLISYHILKK